MLLLLNFTSLSIRLMGRAQTALSAFRCTNSSSHLPADSTAEGKHLNARLTVHPRLHHKQDLQPGRFDSLRSVSSPCLPRRVLARCASAAFIAPLPPRCVSPAESQATGHFSQVSSHKTSLRLTAIATDTHRIHIFSWRRRTGKRRRRKLPLSLATVKGTFTPRYACFCRHKTRFGGGTERLAVAE